MARYDAQTREALQNECRQLRAQGKKIVTTNGCFDILHIGHARILQAARDLGDVLVVGINSDPSVTRLKGPTRPINGEVDRAELLLCLRSVDHVYVFEEDNPIEFLKVVQPDIHVKGSDYTPAQLAETPIVESFGGQVKIIELVPGKSTSSIVSRIQTG